MLTLIYRNRVQLLLAPPVRKSMMVRRRQLRIQNAKAEEKEMRIRHANEGLNSGLYQRAFACDRGVEAIGACGVQQQQRLLRSSVKW